MRDDKLTTRRRPGLSSGFLWLLLLPGDPERHTMKQTRLNGMNKRTHWHGISWSNLLTVFICDIFSRRLATALFYLYLSMNNEHGHWSCWMPMGRQNDENTHAYEHKRQGSVQRQRKTTVPLYCGLVIVYRTFL